MKNALAKYFLGFFGAIGGWHAKRKMKPMLWKHTMQRKAKLHIVL